MDEHGYVSIVDRMKDMVIVSGFNVYPNEIEECIAAMDGIREVGVVGIPSEQTGEAVVAYIVADGEPPSHSDIVAHCRKQLAAYKVPRTIEIRDSLPKSPVGKILRKELRAQFGPRDGADAESGEA